MRTVRVHGACLAGVGAELVTIEAGYDRARAGAGGLNDPGGPGSSGAGDRTELLLTGLPDLVVRESRARILRALAANGLGLRPGRLFINLVPAARRKTGETLDLPLALAACAAAGHLQPSMVSGTLFMGELGIDGKLHGVRGGLAAALAARGEGLARLIAPPTTAAEAAWVPGIDSFGAAQLSEVVALLFDSKSRSALAPEESAPTAIRRGDLDQVRGQDTAKLALGVAAAGGHGLLFVGPPGTGKSMLARRLVSLLPAPTLEERLEISCIQSAAGLWPGGLIRERPVRAPHHSVSHAGLVGGGSPPGPGEITLAHGGVLFLDELPEFRREALEALRTPIEEGRVRIARAGRRIELPAAFQLVCAMNPCPCGYRGHPVVTCPCPESRVERYRRRVSGPLLDRIDLRVELSAPTVEELAPAEVEGGPGTRGGDPGSEGSHESGGTSGASSSEGLAERLAQAAERRAERQGARSNASLESSELDRWVPLSGRSRALIARAAARRAFSARAVQSLRRVALTLADLDDTALVEARHFAQALALRAPIP